MSQEGRREHEAVRACDMIWKTILKVLGIVAIAAGRPPSFSLRTLLALVFGNAIGVAAVMAWAPRTFAELAAANWVALWSGVILGFEAARETRERLRGMRKPSASNWAE